MKKLSFVIPVFNEAQSLEKLYQEIKLSAQRLKVLDLKLFLSMMGLCLFFIFKEKKLGAATFLIGVSWFFVMTFIVIPYFATTEQHWAWGRYFAYLAEVNQGTTESIKKMIFEDPKTGEYILLIFKFFGFLPLLGLPWLILSLPELLINLLSQNPAMKTIYFHYDSGVLPGLLIATIFGLRYLHFFASKIEITKKYAKYILYIAAVWLLIVVLRVNYHYSPLPTTPSCWCIAYQVSEEDKQFDRILKALPKEATITSSTEVRAHLTLRENSFNLPYARNQLNI